MSSPVWEEFKACLPRRVSNASYNTGQHALSLLAGFFRGDDCLHDLESLRDDPGVEDKLREVPSSRAISDWLHNFEDEHVEKLSQFITRMGYACRKNVNVSAPMILDLDSTSHEQAANKMQGLAFNYDNLWCLDSLEAFDELGFCYEYRLRAGNTYSSQGAPEMIEKVLKSQSFKDEKYFRGDSAFCNQEVIKTCIRLGAKFTITAHGNIGWENHLNEIFEWRAWEYDAEEVEKARSKKQKLPKVELGQFVYQPGWSENLRFHVVVKRTELKEKEQTTLFHPQGSEWKYYAVLTNINLYNHTAQSVMEQHAKRGNAENFIREGKYNYDLKHFPCQV